MPSSCAARPHAPPLAHHSAVCALVMPFVLLPPHVPSLDPASSSHALTWSSCHLAAPLPSLARLCCICSPSRAPILPCRAVLVPHCHPLMPPARPLALQPHPLAHWLPATTWIHAAVSRGTAVLLCRHPIPPSHTLTTPPSAVSRCSAAVLRSSEARAPIRACAPLCRGRKPELLSCAPGRTRQCCFGLVQELRGGAVTHAPALIPTRPPSGACACRLALSPFILPTPSSPCRAPCTCSPCHLHRPRHTCPRTPPHALARPRAIAMCDHIAVTQAAAPSCTRTPAFSCPCRARAPLTPFLRPRPSSRRRRAIFAPAHPSRHLRAIWPVSCRCHTLTAPSSSRPSRRVAPVGLRTLASRSIALLVLFHLLLAPVRPPVAPSRPPLSRPPCRALVPVRRSAVALLRPSCPRHIVAVSPCRRVVVSSRRRVVVAPSCPCRPSHPSRAPPAFATAPVSRPLFPVLRPLSPSRPVSLCCPVARPSRHTPHAARAIAPVTALPLLTPPSLPLRARRAVATSMPFSALALVARPSRPSRRSRHRTLRRLASLGPRTAVVPVVRLSAWQFRARLLAAVLRPMLLSARSAAPSQRPAAHHNAALRPVRALSGRLVTHHLASHHAVSPNYPPRSPHRLAPPRAHHPAAMRRSAAVPYTAISASVPLSRALVTAPRAPSTSYARLYPPPPQQHLFVASGPTLHLPAFALLLHTHTPLAVSCPLQA
ncbi:hypothetical protein DENSPDRAFT_934506 [Dentipellis sp. KUC8613]|nr:hypothetical protein DENSPDRAFT_934506 [Dentipellis sp. KUC8613]